MKELYDCIILSFESIHTFHIIHTKTVNKMMSTSKSVTKGKKEWNSSKEIKLTATMKFVEEILKDRER